mmetsp:Transcript_5576/g.17822  ORF Transcript_5576/g.17822 Transcript_5576/m.17822 type:complete len:208 (-) Transcript_5576:368-991(-)
MALGRRALLCSALLVALVCADLAFVQPPLSLLSRSAPGRTQRQPLAAQAADVAETVSTARASSEAWRVALAACAALLVALLPISGAEAARSGGRMGGMGGGMRSAPPPQRSQEQAQSGPRFSSGPNISVGVGPMIAPPMFGPPMLFGPPMGLFGPPMLPLPVPSMGPSVSDQMLQDQQRRDERQMDSQKSQIDALQKEIAELKAKRQ